MGRFRCPTSLDDLSIDALPDHKIAGPSKAPKARAVPKAKGKVKHPHTKAEAKERIRHSQKVYKTRKVPVFKDVWVGNLHPETTESHLNAAFLRYGRITQVVIRLARGSALSPLYGVKQDLSGNKLYASITFYDSHSARRAVRMDGMELNGRKIVVRRDVYDLPEFTGRMQDFIDQQTPQPPPSPLKRGWDNLKMMTVDRTQYIPPDWKPPVPPSESDSPHPAVPDPQDWLVKTKFPALKGIFPKY